MLYLEICVKEPQKAWNRLKSVQSQMAQKHICQRLHCLHFNGSNSNKQYNWLLIVFLLFKQTMTSGTRDPTKYIRQGEEGVRASDLGPSGNQARAFTVYEKALSHDFSTVLIKKWQNAGDMAPAGYTLLAVYMKHKIQPPWPFINLQKLKKLGCLIRGTFRSSTSK